MEVDTKETITKERKMDRENTHGKMGVIIKENGEIIRSTDMEPMSGLMEDSTKEIG